MITLLQRTGNILGTTGQPVESNWIALINIENSYKNVFSFISQEEEKT